MPTRRGHPLWGALDTNERTARPLGERPDGYRGAAYNLARPVVRPQWTMTHAWPVVINPTHPSC